MATAKHKFIIRQTESREWEILAKTSEGKEFWHGPLSMKQSAVRWGQSHLIEGKYPRAVEREDEFGFEDSNAQSISSGPSVNQSIKSLCAVSGVDQEDAADVADFLGMAETDLYQVNDNGRLIWQPVN